ncbi:MAG: DNA polymerase IV [Actinomycetaceae bacterium]|nr:DNA polymerase IV [Actinomycetaceae bacterium]
MSTKNTPLKNHQWGTNWHGCNILHVDMDMFFAAVELLDHPELTGTPVIVGGNRERGVVTSATYEARTRGVRAGIPIPQAIRLCPEATVLPVRGHLYRQKSRQVMALLSAYTPTIEIVSVDEAYLDVTTVHRLHGNPIQIAQKIRHQIHTQLSLTASVGIGPNKLIAKIASGSAKPNGLLLIPTNQVIPFLDQLPTKAIPGIGTATCQILADTGITTVKQLRQLDLKTLTKKFGEAAAKRLYENARGIDERPVTTNSPEKSISTETTFTKNLTTTSQINATLLRQSHECAAKLRQKTLLAHTIGIKLRTANFRTATRSRTVPATDVAAEIYAVARSLAAEYGIPEGGFRLVGTKVEGLVSKEDGFQASLYGESPRRNAECAMDQVAGKFGAILHPATLLQRKSQS